MKKLLVPVLVAGLSLGIANHSSAAVIVLDFEGIADNSSIGNYYNVGGGGTNYGISFPSTTTLALVDQDANTGGHGYFGGEPSPSTVMFFLNDNDAKISVQEGFDTGFSFWYSAIYVPGSVDVYAADDTLLASYNFPVTASNGGDPTGDFSPFYPFGFSFDGIAEHVIFTGVAHKIGFDNITFGSATPAPASAPTPEPASILLMMSGMTGFAFLKRKLQGLSSIGRS